RWRVRESNWPTTRRPRWPCWRRSSSRWHNSSSPGTKTGARCRAGSCSRSRATSPPWPRSRGPDAGALARSRQSRPTHANPEWLAGAHLVRADRLFGRIATGTWPDTVRFRDAQHDVRIPKGEWAVVTPDGDVLCETGIRGSAEEWAYAIAHCILHLCFDHFRPHPDERAWNFGCDAVVSPFLAPAGLGRPPPPHRIDFPPLPRDEEAIYRELALRSDIPENYRPDLLFEERRYEYYGDPPDYPKLFTAALQQAVTEAMRIASGVEPHTAARRADPRSLAQQARSWFMASYPLLGALAASFELIEDMDACRALDIE